MNGKLSRRMALAAGAGTLVIPAALRAAQCRPSFRGGLHRSAFDEYINAFNAKDLPGFTRFYDPEVSFQLGGRIPIAGRQAIIDWYTVAWQRIEEHCEVRRFISDASGVAVELETEFRAVADWHDFSAGPLLTGDILRRIGFIHYDLGPNGFTRVATASHKTLQVPNHW